MSSSTVGGTVAVTGATGFIGGSVVRHLSRQGWRLKVLVRTKSPPRDLLRDGITPVVGSLDDSHSLDQLVRDADAVIHCAGAVRGATRADFYRVNVDGVDRLTRAVTKQSRPAAFLLMSSLAAREPQLSHYAASKRAGEQIVASELANLNWTVFRPPAVYGPGDRELLPLFKLMTHGVAPVVGTSDARFSVLYVEDLARAVECWLNKAVVQPGVYELDDGRAEGYSWADVAEIIEKIAAVRVRRFSVPALLLQIPAVLNWVIGSVTAYKPMLTPGKVRELRHPDWVCDNHAISSALDWHPQVSFFDGLKTVLNR